MTLSLSHWDQRYRNRVASTEPSELLVRFSYLLPSEGLALDVACGSGRNGVFLARQGLDVVGVDRSAEAIRQARELADREHVRAGWVLADLRSFGLPEQSLQVVACFFYRDPALYSCLRDCLRPGGLLFYETYTQDRARFANGPQNPAHLLEAAELLRVFGDWEVLYYRESWIERGVASLVVRKPLSQLSDAADS